MLSTLRTKANILLAEHAHAERCVIEERNALKTTKRRLEDRLAAQTLIQDAAKAVQQKVHRKIAGVVSRCLSAVADHPYEFRMVFEEKRGRTEARMAFIRDGNELDPLSSAGGGMSEVAAFALRVAAVVMSPYRKFLALDEPFKALKFADDGAWTRVCGMLHSLHKDLGMQFLIVSHTKELFTGKVVEL